MGRPGLHNNRKFRRLLALLKEPRPHVRGYLECLWDCAYETGNPVIGDKEDIELAAEYSGVPGTLFDALLAAGGDGPGFIEPTTDTPGLYQIHELHANAPEYVRKRWHRELERRNKHLGAVLSAERRRTAPNGAERQHSPPNPYPPTNSPASAGGGVTTASPERATKPKASRSKDDGAHRGFIALFVELWGKAHGGTAYQFQRSKDGCAVGRILKACENVPHDKLISAYLSDRQDWYVKKGHTIWLLASEINAILPKVKGVCSDRKQGILPDFNPADHHRPAEVST